LPRFHIDSFVISSNFKWRSLFPSDRIDHSYKWRC